MTVEDYKHYEQQYNASIKRAIEEVDPRWTMTGYKGHTTREGVAFVATIRLDGKVVGHIENAGQGGDTRVDFYSPEGENVIARKLWTAEVVRVLPDEGQFSGGEMLVEALLQKAGK